jgi:hypothetical protein
MESSEKNSGCFQAAGAVGKIYLILIYKYSHKTAVELFFESFYRSAGIKSKNDCDFLFDISVTDILNKVLKKNQ